MQEKYHGTRDDNMQKKGGKDVGNKAVKKGSKELGKRYAKEIDRILSRKCAKSSMELPEKLC